MKSHCIDNCITVNLVLSVPFSSVVADTESVVQVHGHGRSNAAAKDSEWVRERQDLERQKPEDVNEVVLSTSGLQSFAV